MYMLELLKFSMIKNNKIIINYENSPIYLTFISMINVEEAYGLYPFLSGYHLVT